MIADFFTSCNKMFTGEGVTNSATVVKMLHSLYHYRNVYNGYVIISYAI